jgi:cytosine/adenosine deaminase-related metal-dependent hydrolase
MADKTLLKGGIVLSLDPDVGNFYQADVLISGSRIEEVASQVRANDAQVIDASNMIVMPGFVDTHRHMWEGILRNIGTDLTLEGEINYEGHINQRIAPAYRPEDVYAGNLISALGAIAAGITTIVDCSHLQVSPEHTDAALDALTASGIRAVFAYGPPTFGGPDSDHAAHFRRLAADRFNSKDQLLTLGLAPHGPEFSSLDVVKEFWNLAREVNARITVHVGVGSFGQQRKLAEAGEAGLLGPDTTYVHCNSLSDREIQLIVDTGGTVSLAAPVEMMMGHGMPPIQRFLDRNLKPSLSVAMETYGPGDMFTTMRSVISLQHAMAFDRKLSRKIEFPISQITTRDVISYATVEGARATALLDKIGTLTPGKAADIIMLRTDRINIVPVNDPIGAVVWGMDTSNIDTVMVAGRILKRHGELVDVDLNHLESLATRSRDYVIEKSGIILSSL